MTKKERFGKFVLLEQADSSGVGSEYRAAKLGPTGLEKIVTLLRLGPAISSNGEVAKQLMDQAKVAAQLQNPNVVKIFGIGKVDAHYYISYEFIEGKSLKAIFHRCRNDGFPFSVDHTLLIASKVCSALEYAHARRHDGGGRYYHGLVTPGNVVVSYEGEVRLRGFGYWPSRLREAGALSEDELLYLSPEQASGGAGDTKSDTFAVGAMLFESLVGQPLFKNGRNADVAARLSRARLQNPAGDDDALPKPIVDVLQRALAVDPGARYAEVQEMRKAIDTLLFSGDFTPTTFNLAFFMHSLFREDIERESKLLKEEKEANYFEFLNDEPKPAPPKVVAATPVPIPTVAMPTPMPTPVPGAGRTPVPATRLASHTPVPGHVSAQPTPLPRDHHAETIHEPERESHPTPLPSRDVSPSLTSREAAAGFTFHRGGKPSRLPVLAGILAVVLIGGGVAYYLTRGSPAASEVPAEATTVTTLSPQAIAAMQRVKELEDRLKTMELERAEAEAKAADEARQKLESQARARGQAVDAAAVAKAQEEAARKARAEQERKQQEERKRLEEERLAEEARLAEERRKAEEEVRRVEEQRKAEEAARAAAVATTTLPPPPPTTVAPIRAGALVNLTDPGVTPPVAERQPQVQYPPIAHRQRVEGTVELNVLIDEKGNVVDAQVVVGAGGKSGLNEAAVENVRRRKYRPATKEGVPVKVWMPVRVKFELPN